ncbi:VIR protein [Plasmodium vivax]|uniref:VIR protein n=1 Tax=Plasmodium vivax TaxID=5855 RepID=A0A1G4E4B2_PLAVI|nr:VIR protein [Plasmodium vivax]
MCSQDSDEESYEFFEKIENYIEKAKSVESTTEYSKADSGCYSFVVTSGSYFTDKERAKIICKQFIKLYDSLDDCKSTSNSDPHRKCSKFLNYWINFKLGEIMQNDDESFCNVYNGIESQFTGRSENNLNLCVTYHIDKDELDKMNILYSLYDKYTDLDTILKKISKEHKQSLLTHSSACCIDYIKASYICNPDNNNNNINGKFCEKLKAFQSKYDKLYEEAAGKGSDYSKNFIRLSECGNNKIITTAVTGSIVGLIPLLGVLYKFTPMVQVLRSKMGILNNDISKNDEEMIKMSLMDQENEQIPFQKKTYNIKYQSL